MAQFVAAGIIEPGRAERLMGSGVDLQRFALRPLPSAVHGDPPRDVTFLLVARLIPEKGIAEYVSPRPAPCVPREPVPASSCWAPPPEGRGLSTAQVQARHDEGVIDYLGTSDDVPEVMAQADCLVCRRTTAKACRAR